MWIIPNNYRPSSAFVPATLESKEDLTLPGLDIASCVMWRSKPSPLRTWLQRWKRVNWIPHLFTRILKPSQRTSFETALSSSLEVIRASRLALPAIEKAPMTPDTCGPLSGDTSKQLDLLDASLKTSKGIYRLDSPASSATWKKMVIEQRGEYSQRVKSEHRTRESESTSWATPTAHLGKEGGYPAEYTRNSLSLTAQAMESEQKPHSSGYLNPDWVEWLMGVPTGWTDLDSWGTE